MKNPLANPYTEKIFVMAALAADSFRLFTSEIIGYDNAPFHNELDDMLSNSLNAKIAIAWPRGFGKTSHISIAYPLWEIARDHNQSILLISSTAEVSRLSLAKITEHIEFNKKYQMWSRMIDPSRKGVRPKMKQRQKREQHWSGDSIIIDREDIKPRDATVTAVGVFGPILSKRANIIIIDDVVNQENSATEEQRQKIKDWIYTTVLPVLLPGGRVICLGNTWHMDDLMSNLLKDPQFDVRKRMPAIIHEATHQDLWQEWANIHLNETLSPEEKRDTSMSFYTARKAEMDEGVELLWTDRFPYTDLFLKRVANPYSFARMYMCDPSIRPNQKFFERDIEVALAKGKDLILQDEARTEYRTEMTTAGLDLSISKETWSDDTVLLTLDKVIYGSRDGVIKAGDYILRNIRRGKFSPGETRDMVVLNEATVSPVATRVETNGYQEMMYRDLGDCGALVTSYKTGAEKNDPAIGVNSLEVLFEQGKFVLPNSPRDARTRQLVSQLVNEMRAFPDGHTGDSLMALWFAFSEMRDRSAARILVPVKQMEAPVPYPANEKEADQQIIARQSIERSNFNPAQELLARAQEANRQVQEHTNSRQEEQEVFRKMMGGY